MKTELQKVLDAVLDCLLYVTTQRQIQNPKMMTKNNATKLISREALLRFWHISGQTSDLTLVVTKIGRKLVVFKPEDETTFLEMISQLLHNQREMIVVECRPDWEAEPWWVAMKRGSTAGNKSYQQVVESY